MRIALVMVLALAIVGTASAEPTFTRDVAPILFKNCAACHRPGQIGPFSLLTYRDARKRARLIARVTETRLMPPWKPQPGHGDFAGARGLSNAQIATLKDWAEAGAPEGDAADLPAPPKFKDGWQLGTPDIILKMPQPFDIPAEGKDIHVHYVFPLKIGRVIHVRGVEFRPSNPRVAHHAAGLFDSSGQARRLNEEAGGNGYRRFGGPGFVPLGVLPFYVPGQTPRLYPPRVAMNINKGTDFVLQMHYHCVGKEETDQTEVGLYLASSPPTRNMTGLSLASEEIDIAPGERRYATTDRFVLPVDMRADSVWAHMHLIGRAVKVWAEFPDGRTEKLLWIDDWDFNWQDTYRFKKPVHLPRGTVVRAEWLYDNTDKNPRNPNDPPQRIRYGPESSDEMANVWLSGEVSGAHELRLLGAANAEHLLQLIEQGKKFRNAR